MKICWDNLDNVAFTRNGYFIINSDVYEEEDACAYCGESFLKLKYRNQRYCCKSCGKMGKPKSVSAIAKMSATRKRRGVSKGKNNPMFGKRFSVAHREKMSKALKGKYSGESAYWYGKTLSEETKDKISISRSGKLMGSCNPNWRGGVSSDLYCGVWKDEGYKGDIRQRDGNKCINPYCLGDYKRLSIHHIDYDKSNCGPNNLITLCVSCNGKANKDREWHTAWYNAIINKRYGGNK